MSAAAIYPLVEAFQALQPKTEIRLTEEVLGGSWDALNDDRCDLVVGAEGVPPSSAFGQHVLGQVVFEFVVAQGHPLTQLSLPLSGQAIQDYPTVIAADSSRHLPARSAGLLDGRSRLLVPSIEHKIDAQVRGLGVGYLPRHRIQRELMEGSLQILPLETVRPPAEISVAWRKNNAGKGLMWFIRELGRMSFHPDLGLLPPQ